MNNNAKAIIRHWKEMYNKTKNAYFARCVFDATGDYPDDIKSWGVSDLSTERHDELEFINNPIY